MHNASWPHTTCIWRRKWAISPPGKHCITLVSCLVSLPVSLAWSQSSFFQLCKNQTVWSKYESGLTIVKTSVVTRLKELPSCSQNQNPMLSMSLPQLHVMGTHLKKTFQVVLKCNVVHDQIKRKKKNHTMASVTYKFKAWLMADACEF